MVPLPTLRWRLKSSEALLTGSSIIPGPVVEERSRNEGVTSWCQP